jgi:hypothetical protein
MSALTSFSEDDMPVRPCHISPVCAYCGEPLVCNGFGVEAWHIGNQFVCNEFCADAIPDEDVNVKVAPPFRPNDLHIK